VLNRRTVLQSIGLGALATALGPAIARAVPSPWPVASARVPPPAGVLTVLPGPGNQLALTIDDGASVAVVSAFADFLRDSGARLTFFVNGANSSWTVNAPALRPMVDSGQVQVGNHTWSHPYLTRLGVDAVADQIRRNMDFLRDTYGVDGTPYFRPPYGLHSATTDRIAADLGYSTITLWSGTIGDSRVINEATLVADAAQSFLPEQIILGHANLPPITHVFGQLMDIVTSRGLELVTLNDVFS